MIHFIGLYHCIFPVLKSLIYSGKSSHLKRKIDSKTAIVKRAINY